MSHSDPHNRVEEILHDSRISRALEEAIHEDVGMGDITSDAVVSHDAVGHAHIIVRESGIVAGVEIAAMVFRLVDESISFTARVSDGTRLEPGTVIAHLDGPLHGILKGERTALNFMQRMSGIATLTKQFVDAVEGSGVEITDTRKTAPGLRVFDKYAVRMGGGVNHRYGLDDMVLIKDNHIASAGGIGNAIRSCLEYLRTRSYSLKIEVEAATLGEVEEALLQPGLDRIMLDNFRLEEMSEAVKRIDHRVEVEASGNVSLERVRAIADTGVDFISVGALTHSVKALDISLEVMNSGNHSDPQSPPPVAG